MSPKALFYCLFIAVLAGLLALLAMAAAPARAQCENPQPISCVNCHAEQFQGIGFGGWHKIHGAKQWCVNCHGGNGSATNKDQAHEGLVSNPLSDIYTSCHQCHLDYQEVAAQYAATLQITPSSRATPTPAVVSNISGGPPPGKIVMPTDMMSSSPVAQPFILISGGLALLAFFFIGLAWLDRHHV
jgi:hypothetical protein